MAAFRRRRTIRLNISTPSTTIGAPFEYSRTLLMVATHEEHRRSRSTRDSQTSTMKNCTPERHFYPTIVSRVDQKWLSGRMKAHSVRLTPVASGMIDGTGRIGPEHSRSAANIKIMFFGVLRGTRGARRGRLSHAPSVFAVGECTQVPRGLACQTNCDRSSNW